VVLNSCRVSRFRAWFSCFPGMSHEARLALLPPFF
jgi:hypothetical protein